MSYSCRKLSGTANKVSAPPILHQLFKFEYLRFIDLLPAIGHLVAYDSTNVLNNHRMLLQILRSVQPQALNAGTCQVHVVLPLSLQAPILGGFGVDKLLAVWCVELSSEGTLVGLGHTGAVKSVRPKKKAK